MALTAVVTGASGYLAGEVIHQLLAKGYNVRGTVTNVEDRRKTGPLVALRKALPGKLTLTEADLFEPGSFDDVVKGADFVFHTASNVIFDSSNPEVRLASFLLQIEDAKGTLTHVCNTCQLLCGLLTSILALFLVITCCTEIHLTKL